MINVVRLLVISFELLVEARPLYKLMRPEVAL